MKACRVSSYSPSPTASTFSVYDLLLHTFNIKRKDFAYYIEEVYLKYTIHVETETLHLDMMSEKQKHVGW